MIFGWEKYENIQDTAPAKKLAALTLLMLNKQTSDTEQVRKLACSILGIKDNQPDPVTDETLKEFAEGNSACETKIPSCEPVFLLRDNELSIKTVEYWIKEAKVSGVSADRIKSAQAQLERMKWFLTNLFF